MLESGKRKARRQLWPEEKWELFLEVTSQEISQADADQTAFGPHKQASRFVTSSRLLGAGRPRRREAGASDGGVVLPAESRTPSGVRPLLRVVLPGEAAAGCEWCSLGELG
jgi:hypothetical protein